MDIRLPPRGDLRWVILGRHHTQDRLIERLTDAGFPPPLVVIDPQHTYDRDRRLLIPHGLFGRLDELAAAGRAVVVEVEEINGPEFLALVARHRCTAAFSTACRAIIKKPVLEAFSGLVFNIHGAWLPVERGGGLNSWKILNGSHSVASTIHMVDEGIDSGAILFRHKMPLATDRPIPLDYDRGQMACSRVVMDAFVDAVLSGLPLAATAQDDDEMIYLPRLHTELNGAIDLDWPVAMVERFVRAFSDPYPGAHTFLKDRRVHLHDAEIVQADGFHPFCNGKVVTVRRDGGVNLVAGGGLLRVREVTVDGRRDAAAAVLRTRHTLHTPAEGLVAARVSVPSVKAMK
ncbi:MAG: hypothetical protein H7840_05430 [Alphaproteobacteria bacterium]